MISIGDVTFLLLSMHLIIEETLMIICIFLNFKTFKLTLNSRRVPHIFPKSVKNGSKATTFSTVVLLKLIKFRLIWRQSSDIWNPSGFYLYHIEFH